MKSALSLIATLLFVGSVCAQEKRVVTYLGTDFILPDGCPMPDCDLGRRSCRQLRLDIQRKYNDCMRSPDGEALGCVTDVLPNKTNITIPIYATFCSAFCYEQDESKLRFLERCPFSGQKHDTDPVLQRLF